jgi:transposase
LIKPAHTSQTCSFCGNLGSRNGIHFSCPFCGLWADADYNASLNIKRAAVNQPIVASDEAEAPYRRTEAEASYKLSASADSS